jgi:hypothetical protein
MPAHIEGYDHSMCEEHKWLAAKFIADNYLTDEMQNAHRDKTHKWRKYLNSAPFMQFPNSGVPLAVFTKHMMQLVSVSFVEECWHCPLMSGVQFPSVA